MQYVELDSISIYLANGMFNNMKCNIILYTNPSIFYIKSTKCKKIGWINIINSNIQCSLVANINFDWSLTYKMVYNILLEDLKKYFFPSLPKNFEKASYYEKVPEFLDALISVTNYDVILYGRGLKSLILFQNSINFFDNLAKSYTHLLNNDLEFIDISKSGSNNHRIKQRIDFSYNFYEKANFCFDKPVIEELFNNIMLNFKINNKNLKVNNIRTFENQFFVENCCSSIAGIYFVGDSKNKIAEITTYYHNSIIFRNYIGNNCIYSLCLWG